MEKEEEDLKEIKKNSKKRGKLCKASPYLFTACLYIFCINSHFKNTWYYLTKKCNQ